VVRRTSCHLPDLHPKVAPKTRRATDCRIVCTPVVGQPSSQPTTRSAIAIGAYFFVNGATYASWVPRLPQIKQALNVSDTQLGLTLVGGVVGSLAMSFAFAPAVTRFGSKRMTMVSSMLLTLLLPLIGLAPSAFVLFGALACLGTVDGFADVAVNTQGLQLQSQRSKSIINRLHGTWSIGALTGGLVASRSAAMGISVRSQLVGTSLVLFTIALVAVRWLLRADPRDAAGTENTKSHTSTQSTQCTASGADPASTIEVSASLGRGAARRAAGIFLLAGAASVLAEIPATEWSTLMIVERFHKSGGAAAIGFVGFAAGMVVGRFVGDAVTDKLGATRTRRLGGTLNALGFLVACTAPPLAVVIFALSFAGLGSSWLNPLLVRRASEVFNGPRGATLAGVGARVGILFGSPLMGRISDTFSRSTALLIVGGGAASIMMLLRLPGDVSVQLRPLPK
jgi:MFS family permease